jgi:hypothetical protein
VSDKPTESLKHPPNSTFIQPIEEKGEAFSDLVSVEEPLSIEAGFGSLHILVLETPSNENGLALSIFHLILYHSKVP